MTAFPAVPANEISLDATFETHVDKVRVSYVVTNLTAIPRLVTDDLLVRRDSSFARDPELLIIREDDADDDSILLLRGAVAPRATVVVIFNPGVRRLEPHASLHGVAVTELPLVARHPQERQPRPIPGKRSRVVLAVGIADASAVLIETPVANGPPAQVLSNEGKLTQRWARSAPFVLPG